jgi:hypothetical protein
MSIARALPVALPLLLLLAACSDSPSEVVDAPELLVTIESPNGSEGAALLRIGAVGVLAEPAAPEEAFVFADPHEGETFVGVVLDDPGEIRFVLRRDGRSPPPAVEVLSVSDPEDRLRESTAGYVVRVAPRGEG